MRNLWYFLLLSITFKIVTGQAPGDETGRCLTRINRQSFANQILLMSSHNYEHLIEEDGPWIVRNEDNNNDGRGLFGSQTTVSGEIPMEFSKGSHSHRTCRTICNRDQNEIKGSDVMLH